MIALTPARVPFAIAVLAAIVLTAIAATGALMPGDRVIADVLQATPGGSFFDAIADFISPRHFQFPIVGIAAAYALIRRNYALAAVALFALAATYLNPAVKNLIERPRPGPDDVIIREGAPGYGYPSGHVWIATLTFGYAIAVALRHATGVARTAIVTACAAAIALIAWNRVWDGAHWPSDTLGSLTICGSALAAAVALATLPSRRHHHDAGLNAEHAVTLNPPMRDTA